MEYSTGQFHPKFDTKSVWYFCHPAFGLVLANGNYDVNSQVFEHKSESWAKLDEDVQDSLTDRFSGELVEWFAETYQPEMYFSGGYEDNELSVLQTLGLKQVGQSKWNQKYKVIITEINVHELALVGDSAKLVIFETWDQIFVNIPPLEIPEKFTKPWA